MHDDTEEELALRRTGIATREIGAEVVVYDLDTDKVHLLNPVASAVWRLLDERPSSVAAVIEQVTGAFAEHEGAEVLVRAALQDLTAARLLRTTSTSLRLGGLDRRRLLKLAGAAAVLGPALTTILAPPAAATHSAGNGGTSWPNGSGTCTSATASHCASGVCGADNICGTCKTQSQTCTTSAGSGADRCCAGACTSVGSSKYCCAGNGSNGTTTTCCSKTVSSGTCVCTPAGTAPNVAEASLCCSPATALNSSIRCCYPNGTTTATVQAAGQAALASNDDRCCSGNTTSGNPSTRACA